MHRRRCWVIWLARVLALELIIVLGFVTVYSFQPQSVINERVYARGADQERRLSDVERVQETLRNAQATTRADVLVLQSDVTLIKYLAGSGLVALLGQFIIVAYGVKDRRRAEDDDA